MRKPLQDGLILGILMWLLLSVTLFRTPVLTEQVAEVYPSVVYVGGIDEYGNKWNGSGVIIGPDGWILTAKHVVRNSVCMTVLAPDGMEYLSSEYYMDPDNDVALIKINPEKNLPYSGFGNGIRLGETIFIIGSPFGQFNSVNLGIISGMERYDSYFGIESMIQLDVAGNPGNSGCPVFNMDGKIVGILVGGIWGADGMIIATSLDTCKDFVDRYIIKESLPVIFLVP